MAPFEALNRRDMPDAERWMTIAASAAFCFSLFCLTWIVSSSYGPLRHTFRKFDFKNKCDFASRVPSVVHANVVLFFLFRETLFNVEWNEWFQTKSDLTMLERNMCFSAGYFLYDLSLILWSKMDLWQIFVFHHVAALWPLFGVLFFGCENYAFFGTGYFFVEMTILPLQLVSWCENLKNPRHWLARVGFHLTFWLWLPFRLVLPVYMTYHGIITVMGSDDTVGFWQCKLPVGQGGVSIWVFCWAIFVLHIAPGYYKRAILGQEPQEREAPAAKEARVKKASGRPGPLAKSGKPGTPMSPVASPTFKTAA